MSVEKIHDLEKTKHVTVYIYRYFPGLGAGRPVTTESGGLSLFRIRTLDIIRPKCVHSDKTKSKDVGPNYFSVRWELREVFLF
jgi:hypothetical protein